MGKEITEKYRKKVFRAKTRLLLDYLFGINGIFFILFALQPINRQNLLLMAIGVNVFLPIVWYFVVSPLTKIQITNGVISGRDGYGRKNSFPIRKVYMKRTMARQYPLAKWFYKDIWSLEGKSIRVQRRIIGQDQLRLLMVLIQDYPLKEMPLESDGDKDQPRYSSLY